MPASSHTAAPPSRRWRVPAFVAWGAVGFAIGTAAGLTLGLATNRSVVVVAAMSAASATAFFVVAFATKALSGEETLTFYHHAVAVSLACVTLLILWGVPLLPYLDLAAVGLLAFLVFGRLGCRFAGCCHGRPHPWGIRYSTLPDSGGLPAYLVGVTLLPVQVFEAVASAVIALVGATMAMRSWPPGAVLVWCVCAYAASRFAIEFGRGDDCRRYLWGLSVPQWTSVALAALCGLLAVLGYLPEPGLAVGCALALAITTLAVALRLFPPIARYDLLGAAHTHELSHVLDAGAATALMAGSPRIWPTSHGLLLSTDTLVDHGRAVRTYTLSHAFHPLDARMAARVARRIMLLRHNGHGSILLTGPSPGVYHLVVGDPAEVSG
jgi:hypothetical protein